MHEKDHVSKSQKEKRPEEEVKLKREERQPAAEGPICTMCGGGKLMWILWVVIIVLIILAFLR